MGVTKRGISGRDQMEVLCSDPSFILCRTWGCAHEVRDRNQTEKPAAKSETFQASVVIHS